MKGELSHRVANPKVKLALENIFHKRVDDPQKGKRIMSINYRTTAAKMEGELSHYIVNNGHNRNQCL